MTAASRDELESDEIKAHIEEMRANVHHMRTTDRREAVLILIYGLIAATAFMAAGAVLWEVIRPR